MSRPGEPPFAWRDGVHVVGSVLWCDAPRARDLSFISDGRVRLERAPRKLLATARTLQLLTGPATRGARAGAKAGEALVTPFGRPFSLGAARLELFPTGRLPGAAAILVQPFGHAGRRVAYCGEPRPRSDGAGLAEACEVRGAEAIALAAPLAALERPFPSASEVLATLIARVQGARSDGKAVVVLAQTPGPAEEALVALARAGVPVRAHPRVAATVEAYRRGGLAIDRAPVARLAPRGESDGPLLDGALVWPIELHAAVPLARLRDVVRLALTPLAVDESRAAALRERLAVTAALPFADGADLDDLVRFAVDSGARSVHLTAGYSDGVARALAARGIACAPLGPPRQLELF